MATTCTQPLASTSRRNSMAQFGVDLNLQPVLVWAPPLPRNGLVEAQRGAWRGQVDYPSKLAVRQLSCLLGFALAAASRTFWKRPQDEPGCAASTTKASITATVERPKGERNFNKTKTKKKNTPFFENTSFSKSVGLTTSASTTLTLPRCRRVVRITRCQMP